MLSISSLELKASAGLSDISNSTAVFPLAILPAAFILGAIVKTISLMVNFFVKAANFRIASNP